MQRSHDIPIDIRQMEAFSAIMSAGSITAAARLLGRSQPAISRLIQDLEARLGFSLLHRNGPRVSPTRQGLLFGEEAERFLASFRHMQERAFSIGHNEPPPLSVDAIPALAAGLLPLTLARLQQHMPMGQLSLHASSAEQVVQAVLGHRTDLGVTSLPVEHAGLDLHWIGESGCVAVLSADDPLARHETLSISELGGQCLITMSNPHRLRGRIDRTLAAAGVEPASLMVTNASINAIMAARAGLGIAIVEPATAYTVPIAGVAIRTLDQRIPYFWGVFTAAGRPLSKPIEALIDLLADVSVAALPYFRRHGPDELDSLRDDILGPMDGGRDE
ncbi:MAG: LysR family transcriptional regulator [Devosia sp.]|nr:LysR family transcriptional regulator [Devosia sp.]